MHFKDLGDSAILLEWEQKIDASINHQVHHLNEAILDQKIPGIRYTIPAYSSLCIAFNPLKISKNTILVIIDKIKNESELSKLKESHCLKIPVCYDVKFGLDLQSMSKTLNLSIESIIEKHYDKRYQVYMLGFMLGFPYMGIVDPIIQMPRKNNPRKEVSAGSIGIAGNQTGIYPSNAPGGWQIIGRTPIEIFDISKGFPFTIEAGDYIQFHPVSIDEYYKIKAAHKTGDYQVEYEK